LEEREKRAKAQQQSSNSGGSSNIILKSAPLQPSENIGEKTKSPDSSISPQTSDHRAQRTVSSPVMPATVDNKGAFIIGGGILIASPTTLPFITHSSGLVSSEKSSGKIEKEHNETNVKKADSNSTAQLREPEKTIDKIHVEQRESGSEKPSSLTSTAKVEEGKSNGGEQPQMVEASGNNEQSGATDGSKEEPHAKRVNVPGTRRKRGLSIDD